MGEILLVFLDYALYASTIYNALVIGFPEGGTPG